MLHNHNHFTSIMSAAVVPYCNCPRTEEPYCTLAYGAVVLGDAQASSPSTDEASEPPPPPLPRSSEPAADRAGDRLALELLANTLALPSPSARNDTVVCAEVSTDVGDPSSCCIRRGGGGFSSRLSSGAGFLAAPSTLRGYGRAGFLLGRGGGIWIAGAAPAEALLPDEDSRTTCM